jgi:hypothetical protein
VHTLSAAARAARRTAHTWLRRLSRDRRHTRTRALGLRHSTHPQTGEAHACEQSQAGPPKAPLG